MTETTFFVEIIKNLGVAALIFVIWYIDHQSQQKQQKDTVEAFNKIIDEQAKREERNFNLLKEMLETNQYHGSLLSRICEKIDNNQWCPYIKNLNKDNGLMQQKG